jgi:hypothetical protein
LSSKHTQVLGKIGRFHTNPFQECADRLFALRQALNDMNAGGVGEDLKHGRFESAQSVLVIFVHQITGSGQGARHEGLVYN